MEYISELNDYPPEQPKDRRHGQTLKILASLIIVIMIFTAGLLVGRGDKIQIKGLSVTRSKAAASQLDYASVDQLYDLLKTDFDGQLDASKFNDGLKAGLVNATGDPYTEYFSAADAKDFNDQLSGTFTGIGAELGSDTDSHIVIVSPLSGYPAEKAGLKPKDIISAIDGQTTNGISIGAAVKKIRGPADSDVKLTIVRGTSQPFEVTIKRTQISLPSVESKVENGVGYLKISQFTNDTADLATKAAKDFKTQNVKGVVVDLRGDPGGYLSSAVAVSSLWLDKGKVVVSEKRGSQVLETDYASGNNILKGLPTVVIINGGSASASEITAGALRDNYGATVIGDKSFGKGSVQKVETLAGGAEVKITIARWYTPKGANIDKQGITPDVQVGLSDDDQKSGRDPQKDKAYQILRSKFQ